MQIDKDLILKLEKLAKLDLSKTEKEEIMGDLNQILQMVEKMERAVKRHSMQPLRSARGAIHPRLWSTQRR